MASPAKWKFRKEPYQLNFKQNWNKTNVIYTIINTKISSSSHSSDDMWENIEMIFCKIFLAKYFLQYFQYSLDTPFLDSIHIPILKNRYHIYIHTYIYIYIDPIYNILYQYISSPGKLPKVLMYIYLFFLFSKYYWLSNLFLCQCMIYLLLTWSSFVWWHVISSVPPQMLMIKTLSSLFDVLCQSEFRDSEKCCECVKMVFVGTDMS